MKIKTSIQKTGKRFSQTLQDKSERLSATGKKIFLGMFCCTFLTGSIVVAVNSLLNKPRVTIQPITTSKPAHEEPPKAVISKSEYERIEAFKNQNMDKISPGLMDSIRQFENIYLSQQKK